MSALPKPSRSGLASRLGLAPRLALQILLILLTIVAVDRLSRVLVPMPPVIFMDHQWLAGTVAEARQRVLAAPPEQRPAVVAALPSPDLLTFALADRPPAQNRVQGKAKGENLQSLKRALETALPPGTPVAVSANDFPVAFDRSFHSVAVVVMEVPARLVDVLEDSREGPVILTPGLHVSVALDDGSWLTARQTDDTPLLMPLIRNLAAPVTGIVVILLLSYRASRVLLTPLRRLSFAAERLGRERSIVALPEMRIPEYKAIADSFTEMQRRLKRFVDQRTQMLAAISHDLNTPLTRLRLIAEDIPDGRAREQVLANVEEMTLMIQSVLTFARDDLQETPVAVDLASLLISLCDTMSDAGQRVHYRGPDHASLPCRPVAVRRALANLIDNACKYGGCARVALEERPEAIVITVADEGPGIPEADRERALAPFQRLEESRNRETGGTGLGLTIARDIVHSHGGDLTLADGEPRGLLVTLRLPRPRAAAA